MLKLEETAKRKEDIENRNVALSEKYYNTKKELGRDCKKLAFVCGLGDPSRLDRGKQKDANTGKATIKLVGARFKVLEPITYYSCLPKEDFRSNLMSYDESTIELKTAEPGQILDLTPFEYGMLLSQPEFNGYCLGGDIPVALLCPKVQAKDPMGSAKALPRVSLRSIYKNKRLKDFSIEPVLEYKEVTNPETGQTKKVKTIRPGFEKFTPLVGSAKKPVKAKKTEPEGEATTQENVNATRFLELLGKAVSDKTVLHPKA
jgi:hypothetical protein